MVFMKKCRKLSSVGIEAEIAKELGITENRAGDDHPVGQR
jgi:hypothetical protein